MISSADFHDLFPDLFEGSEIAARRTARLDEAAGRAKQAALMRWETEGGRVGPLTPAAEDGAVTARVAAPADAAGRPV
jgi:hypothetical protein